MLLFWYIPTCVWNLAQRNTSLIHEETVNPVSPSGRVTPSESTQVDFRMYSPSCTVYKSFYFKKKFFKLVLPFCLRGIWVLCRCWKPNGSSSAGGLAHRATDNKDRNYKISQHYWTSFFQSSAKTWTFVAGSGFAYMLSDRSKKEKLNCVEQ